MVFSLSCLTHMDFEMNLKLLLQLSLLLKKISNKMSHTHGRHVSTHSMICVDLKVHRWMMHRGSNQSTSETLILEHAFYISLMSYFPLHLTTPMQFKEYEYLVFSNYFLSLGTHSIIILNLPSTLVPLTGLVFSTITMASLILHIKKKTRFFRSYETTSHEFLKQRGDWEFITLLYFHCSPLIFAIYAWLIIINFLIVQF